MTLSWIGAGTDGWRSVSILCERRGGAGDDYKLILLLFWVELWNKFRWTAFAEAREHSNNGDSNDDGEEFIPNDAGGGGGDKEEDEVGKCITCSGLSKLAMEASSNSIRAPSSNNSYNFIKYYAGLA